MLLFLKKHKEKKTMRNFFIILLLVSIILTSNAEERPFIWVDDEDYCPAIYRGKDGKPTGIFNEIMTELFKRLHIPLKKEVYPWKRAQKLIKEGKADGMITTYTKERQKYMVVTKPIWYINETLLFRRDNPKACKILKVNSFDDLREFIIVETIGSGWTEEKYKEHGIKKIIWVPTVDSAFNMVAKGRADVYMMYSWNAFSLLLKKRAEGGPLAKGYQNMVAIAPTFATLPFRLLIRKDSPFAKRIEDFNRVIEEMKKDGTFRRIKIKYAGMTPVLCNKR